MLRTLTGPLVTRDERSSSYVQIGIASFVGGPESQVCSTENGIPNVFARVTYFMDFINRNIQGKTCSPA